MGTLPHSRRQDRNRRPRGADEPRSGRGRDRAPRSPAPHGRSNRTAGLPRAEPARRSPQPPAGRTGRRRRGQACERATDGERPVPPLPHTTPHTLRRTYISIALLANNFDVKWVMGQVGHADSKMTMDVYAQLEQRVDRSHGTSFDRLMRRAREQVASFTLDPDEGFNGRRGRKSARRARFRTSRPSPQTCSLAGQKKNGEGGNRTHDTTIFSRVLYQLSYLARVAYDLRRTGRLDDRREHLRLRASWRQRSAPPSELVRLGEGTTLSTRLSVSVMAAITRVCAMLRKSD
jgi:Phage integrase family